MNNIELTQWKELFQKEPSEENYQKIYNLLIIRNTDLANEFDKWYKDLLKPKTALEEKLSILEKRLEKCVAKINITSPIDSQWDKLVLKSFKINQLIKALKKMM